MTTAINNTISLLGKSLWLGLAALTAIVLTILLTFEASNRDEAAVLHVRERGRLGRQANILFLSWDDAARGYLAAGDSSAILIDKNARVAMIAVLDSLAKASESVVDERSQIEEIRTEIATWDTTFAQAAFASHESPAIPRLLIGASSHLFGLVDHEFQSLRDEQDHAFARALRTGDLLRVTAAAVGLIEISLIFAGFYRLRSRLIRGATELTESQTEILERLALATEVRDNNTLGHTQRVAKISTRIAQAIGLDESTVDLIRRSAPLHDIGKLGIPDSILFKSGPLDDDERAVMNGHAALGAKILSRGTSDIIKMAERIARSHHEKWDGTGYPDALQKEAIPLEARIVAIADVFDALSSDRPYTKGRSLATALDKIRELRGNHFDPRLTDVFFERRCYEGHGTGQSRIDRD